MLAPEVPCRLGSILSTPSTILLRGHGGPTSPPPGVRPGRLPGRRRRHHPRRARRDPHPRLPRAGRAGGGPGHVRERHRPVSAGGRRGDGGATGRLARVRRPARCGDRQPLPRRGAAAHGAALAARRGRSRPVPAAGRAGRPAPRLPRPDRGPDPDHRAGGRARRAGPSERRPGGRTVLCGPGRARSPAVGRRPATRAQSSRAAAAAPGQPSTGPSVDDVRARRGGRSVGLPPAPGVPQPAGHHPDGLAGRAPGPRSPPRCCCRPTGRWAGSGRRWAGPTPTTSVAASVARTGSARRRTGSATPPR